MKFGIKKQLIFGIILLALVPLISGIITLTYEAQIDVSQNVLEKTNIDKELINNFNGIISNNTLGYMDAIVDKDSFKVVDEIKNKHIAAKKYFNEHQEKLVIIVEKYLDKNKSKELISDFNNYWENGDGLIKSIENKKIDKTSEYDDIIDGLNEKLQGDGFKLITFLNNDFNKAKLDLDKSQEISVMVSKISIIFSIVFAIALGFKLFKNITRELNLVKSEIEKSKNSMLEISEEFRELGFELNKTMTTQAGALHQTVAALEEINATVSRNAETAKSSEEYADECVTAANSGRDTVRNMTTTMTRVDNDQNKIIEILNQTNSDVLNLVSVINNVTEKTKVINDIVFQTKLLSFNASVEAARAGEMGKGFAVVAEEVGNLASMSGIAAKEINEILQSSTSQVEAVVTKMQSSVDIIKKSSEENLKDIRHSKTECEVRLQEIMGKVSDLKMMSTNIAVASKEQSVGVHEISKSVHDIDNATMENTELAKVCEEKALHLVDSVASLEKTFNYLNKSINS